MRCKPDCVYGETLSISNDFYHVHHFVTLTADVMLVNGISFLTALSRKIKRHTVEHVQTQNVELLSSALKKVMKIYAQGGFIINLVFI